MGKRIDRIKHVGRRIVGAIRPRPRVPAAVRPAIAATDDSLIAEAIYHQVAAEIMHPIPFSADQRIVAIMQRVKTLAARDKAALPGDAELRVSVTRALIEHGPLRGGRS